MKDKDKIISLERVIKRLVMIYMLIIIVLFVFVFFLIKENTNLMNDNLDLVYKLSPIIKEDFYFGRYNWVDVNNTCNQKGDIIYSYKEDYDNFYVTSCSSNGKRIIVVFPKEYINPFWDFEVYYPINITINTSPRRDISYFQDNLTKVIYPVVDGIAELGVHNVYETIVLVDVSDEMYVVSRLFCKDGVIKLGDTDDSNIKSVECKEQLQKEIGGNEK